MVIRTLLLLFALCVQGFAQEYPTRPITVIEPLAAGAGVDVMMRLYADAASRQLGQRILVENKTGSGGIVGAVAVKDAPPDGYTLFNANQGTHAILRTMQALPYDPVKDFEAITNLFTFATYLVVPASLPVKTAGELADLARNTPGGLRFATQGVGSGTHLLGAVWNNVATVPFAHIPYRGGSQIMPDLLTGRVDFTFSGLVVLREHVAAGKLRILAIAGTRRGLPDIPTMAEAGFPGVDLDAWFGLAAPAGTPKHVVDKLNAAFVAATSDQVVMKRATDENISLTTSTPADFRALWISEEERWGNVVRALKIKLE